MSSENLLMIEWSEKTVSIFDRSTEDPFNCENSIETPIATIRISIDECGYRDINTTNEMLDAVIGTYKRNIPVEYSDYNKNLKKWGTPTKKRD